MTSRRRQGGFTLLELLVVIGILGVLAAVVMIAVGGFSKQADTAACASDQRNIVDAEEVQHAEAGTYLDEAGLVAAGRLRSLSSNHDVVLTSGGYEVVPIGACATDGEVAEAAATGDPAPLSDAGALEAADLRARTLDEAEDAAAEVKVSSFGEGWVSLGAAELSDDGAVLTPKKEPNAVGAVMYGTPVKADGLRVTFSAWSAPGGEGLALVLLDPKAGAESLGDGGAGLGAAGLPGYAVTIDSDPSAKGEPGRPFAGLARTSVGFEYLATSKDDLHDGWHDLTVEVRGGVLVVSVDGTTMLEHKVELPDEVIVGFTGATGEKPGRHIVSKVTISS